MTINEDMRVIAVGDDDQNIYEFRGSNSVYLKSLIKDYGAIQYEMIENYRNCSSITALANEFAKKITNRMKSTPIEAVVKESGNVKITRHVCSNMEEAVVKELLENDKRGKNCILTNTNDEALRVLGLLLKHGKRAKLIQSLDGFRLYNLLEVRAFLKILNERSHSPIISDETWENAKKILFDKYGNSTCIDNVKRLVRDFEITRSIKYRSDFEEFINESKYEDFYDEENQDFICVSTIHKSKGREFDNVYMLLKNSNGKTDAECRALYVGMTRAKQNLYIHTNTGLFDKYCTNGIEQVVDRTEYGEPSEIVLQTTHKDVVLDFFKDKKEIIFNLRSGMKLKYVDTYLEAEFNGRAIRVVKFSKSFLETLVKLKGKGYMPTSVEVKFVVAWKGKEDEGETPILLLEMHLERIGF